MVLYQGLAPIWATNTSGRATSSFAMQGDGNLVLYAASGAAIWNSRTSGAPGAFLAIQDDGNVVLYSGARALWTTRTCCR